MNDIRALEVEAARCLIAGEEAALERFVEIFRARIFDYCHLHCRQREDSEEAAQEIVLKLCEAARSMADAGQARAWVFGIAQSVCASYVREEQAIQGQPLSLEHLPPHWHREMVDRHVLPDDEAYQHEIRRLLGKAIWELPNAFRAAVFLRDWQGLGWHEVAGILEMEEGEAQQRVLMGHEMIRRRLDSHFHGRKAG